MQSVCDGVRDDVCGRCRDERGDERAHEDDNEGASKYEDRMAVT